MEGKVWVTVSKGCDKTIFEGLDGSFYGIGDVQVGRDDLKSNSFLAHEAFEECWALVFHNLGGWVETVLGQLGVHSRLCADEFVLTLLFHRLGINCVAIMVIKDHDIFAAATGGHRGNGQFDCLKFFL